MMTRRQFSACAPSLASSAAMLQACTPGLATPSYEEAMRDTWRLGIDERAITIVPDLARRCPAVDPDDHHLFVLI
jgi:hypothetical protein